MAIDNIEKLEEYEERYGDSISEWELNSIIAISGEIRRIGNMTPEQLKKYNAEKEAKKKEKEIVSALALALLVNIKSSKKAYNDFFDSVHNRNEYLYDYRKIKFTPVSSNKPIQRIIDKYVKQSGKDILKISKTSALKVIDGKGNTVALRKEILLSFKKAAQNASGGKVAFNEAMRSTIKNLGGGGMRVEYGSGRTVRLDTVVRQNLIYNVKMASAEYNQRIGNELGCDGIEIDYHTNPRPSHEFMQGKQFAKKHGVTVGGVYYEGAIDKGVYDRLYSDYGCKHFETDIILGVSVPRYSDKELSELKKRDTTPINIDGLEKTPYQWSQDMRKLESGIRNAKTKREAFKAAGNKQEAEKYNDKINRYKQRYNEIVEGTGMKAQPERMRVIVPK